MEENKKCNHQMEINDLIDNAITNAVSRRELAEEEALLALSDEEITRVVGGLTSPTIAGFKPIKPPYLPPTKPPIKPIRPIVVGLIVAPSDDTQLA